MARPGYATLPWSFVINTSLAFAGVVLCAAIAATGTTLYEEELTLTELSDHAMSLTPKLEVAVAETHSQPGAKAAPK